MSDKEQIDLKTKIIEAMKVSAKKMIETKKRLGQKLVISENGIIKIVEPN